MPCAPECIHQRKITAEHVFVAYFESCELKAYGKCSFEAATYSTGSNEIIIKCTFRLENTCFQIRKYFLSTLRSTIHLSSNYIIWFIANARVQATRSLANGHMKTHSMHLTAKLAAPISNYGKAHLCWCGSPVRVCIALVHIIISAFYIRSAHFIFAWPLMRAALRACDFENKSNVSPAQRMHREKEKNATLIYVIDAYRLNHIH